MKLQVNINDDLLQKIDNYAEYIGISRSALCATFIYEGIVKYENIDISSKGILVSSLDSEKI